MINEELMKRYNLMKSLFDNDPRKEQFNKMMEYFEKNTNYLTAPASTKYHLSIPHGLLIHSCNVTQAALKIKSVFNPSIPNSSCVVAGLLHDLGKHDEYEINPPTPKQVAAGYAANPPYLLKEHELWLDHRAESIWLLYNNEQFEFKLTKQEYQAIFYHNGNCENPMMNFKKGDLMWILHAADLLATNIIESEKGSKW